MAEYWGIKVEDIFNSMKERFRPEGAKGVDASYGYDIKDEGKWKLTVKNDSMTLEKGADLSGCVSTMVTNGENFVGINTGKVDAAGAFTSGKVKVEGDLGAFGKTGKMFRKYVPPKREMTTRDYLVDMFGTVEARFKKDVAKDLDFIITIVVSGSDGGVWSVTIKNGTCKVKEGPVDNPTVTLEVGDKDWVDLTLGKVDAQTLLSAGKGSVKGEIAMAMKWGEIFEKYVDPMGSGEKEQELIVLKKTISVDMRYATGPIMGKFLKAFKDRKILGNKCPKCGRIQLPAREVCAECRVRVTDFVEVGPKGQVRYMEYVYYASPDPLTGETRETPYGMANILLDGCKGNDTFAHLIRRDQIDLIKGGNNEVSGTRVRPVWNENPQGNIFDLKYFEIDE
ncbi:MAG: SCP2 sterol-binding domain-containing protein [Spirochaetes bacterium]|nr:SCP2 sterol-binding domain-containing protein [Spirochaetota bacterium]